MTREDLGMVVGEVPNGALWALITGKVHEAVE